MMTAVNGYYNGRHIIVDEKIHLVKGQKVIVTILDHIPSPKGKVDLKQYMGRGKKMFHTDAAEYVKDLRNNDRV